MKKVIGYQVFNGTHGELWIDGDYMAEIQKFSAEVELKKDEFQFVKHHNTDFKVTGYSCKGSIEMKKVSSYFLSKMSDNMRAGKTTVCQLVASISDPDAIGSERIVIKDAVFDKLTLMDFEAGKSLDESYDFTFTDWEVLDSAI